MPSPGILDIVKELDGGPYFTIGQVARMVDRSPDTIRRWQQDNPDLAPQEFINLGDKGYRVWIYSYTDVKKYKKYASEQKIGRPKGS